MTDKQATKGESEKEELGASEEAAAPEPQRTRKLGIALIALGVVFAGLAIAMFFKQDAYAPQPPSVAASDPKAAPSAVKPTPAAVKEYSVAPTLPKYLAIPAIGVSKTRVLQLGLTKDNQIASPDNIHDAGWYSKSAKPGEAGAAFIYGHVSSWEANGVFYDLKKLKPGDTATVTTGSDKVYTYTVKKSVVYPYDKVDMPAVLSPVDGTSGLNLMTCTGKVIKGTSNFDKRLVVYLSLAGG
jgi:LPXTG-site transpeptidase (sortase) family protein